MAHSGGLTRQQYRHSCIVAVFHQPAAALMRVALQSNPGGSHLTHGHKKTPPYGRGLTFMAHSGGFEPPTARFVAEYSIQLSYECVIWCFRGRVL